MSALSWFLLHRVLPLSIAIYVVSTWAYIFLKYSTDLEAVCLIDIRSYRSKDATVHTPASCVQFRNILVTYTSYETWTNFSFKRDKWQYCWIDFDEIDTVLVCLTSTANIMGTFYHRTWSPTRK